MTGSEPFGWGMSPAYKPDHKLDQLYLNIDSGAATVVTKFDGDLKTNPVGLDVAIDTELPQLSRALAEFAAGLSQQALKSNTKDQDLTIFGSNFPAKLRVRPRGLFEQA